MSYARPSSDSIKGANLYVSGFSKSMTQQELERTFGFCGQIISARIIYDNTTGNLAQTASLAAASLNAS